MSSSIDECLKVRRLGVSTSDTEALVDIERSRRFAYPIADDLKCGICMDVMVTPVTVCPENHVFCEQCIVEWKSHQSCPQCRRPLNREFAPLRLAQNLIHKARVYCDHHKSGWWRAIPGTKRRPKRRRSPPSPPSPRSGEGCDWVGELATLPQHLKECGYVKVFCPYDGCPLWEGVQGPNIYRKDIKEHSETCTFRLLPCEHCAHLVPQNQMETHIASACLEFEVKCENECGATMKRKDHQGHLCPKQIINCEFGIYGCDQKLMRKEMAMHYHESLTFHQTLIAQRVRDMDNKLAMVLAENKKLNQRLLQIEKDSAGSRGVSWDSGPGFGIEFTVEKWSEQKFGENIFSKAITRSARTWKLCLKRENIHGVEHLGVFLHLDSGPVPVTITYKLKILHFRTREVVSTFFPDTARTFLSCKGWGFRGWSLESLRQMGAFSPTEDHLTAKADWKIIPQEQSNSIPVLESDI